MVFEVVEGNAQVVSAELKDGFLSIRGIGCQLRMNNKSQIREMLSSLPFLYWTSANGNIAVYILEEHVGEPGQYYIGL